MAVIKKFTKRGFTLIELMIVVVIIGILASLAIYGVQRYVASSKSAEAKTMLGRLSKDMLSFFEGENQNYQVLGFSGTAAITRSLCPTTANTIPEDVPVKAKAMPADGAFKQESGWECIGTSWSSPTYYAYSVTSAVPAATALTALPAADADDTFTAIAQGDLDGDGDFSTFSLGGLVQQDTDGPLVLTLATTINEVDPEE